MKITSECAYSFLQESLQWLLSKSKLEEVEVVIRRLAKFSKKTVPDVLFDKEDVKEEMVNIKPPRYLLNTL